MKRLTIDVWSDVACPWCFIGKRRLDAALATFGHAAETDVTFHAFELDPSAPRTRDDGLSQAERLAKKYRLPTAQAEQMIARVVGIGAEDGIAFRYDQMRSGNTFDAHRLIRLALERGKQAAMKDRLLRGYFTEGVAIGDPDALVPLAVEVGLDEAEVRAMLAGDRYADAVRADEQLASELGITGVPFFVLAGKYGVSGAQPRETLLAAAERAWTDVAAQ